MGYNGAVLAFRYNGVHEKVGESFTSGSTSASVSTAFPQGITVELVVDTVPAGLDTTTFGYEITDASGATLVKKTSFSSSWVAGQVLEYLTIPSQTTLANKLSSGTGDESDFETTVISTETLLEYKVAITVLSVLLVLFIGLTVFACRKLKKQKIAKEHDSQSVGSSNDLNKFSVSN